MVSSAPVSATLQPPGATLTGACGVLIPAYNEAATVASVVEVALGAALGPVLVVDDGSNDATAERALAAGAAVLRLRDNQGKGGAVHAGAERLETGVTVLLDADLVGLTPQHVRDLAAPVLEGKLEMTRGTFTGGRWRTTAAQQITPQLNGQRAILREHLLSVPGLRGSRYGVEIAITDQAKRARWRAADVALHDVSQVMKEEKRGWLRGVRIRLGMYRDILRTWLRTWQ